VLSLLSARLRAFAASVAARIRSALREVTRPLPLVTGFITDLGRSRQQLTAENALLRQQLIVASRKVKRPAFRPHERGLLVLLSRVVHNWRNAVLLVKPDTILHWHREGFRLFWRWKSRPPRKPPSRLPADVIDLIRHMASSNATGGAERIRGELLKLGIHVAKRTIQKYIRAVRPAAPPRGQRWHTFLQNHTVWACDFLQTYDIWFTAPAALPRFARAVGLRATRPLRGLRALRLGAEFDRVAKGAGTKVIRTAIKAPLMNSIMERYVGSVRREALDHVIILSERHMKSVLEEYSFRYFNTMRPHQGLAQRIPDSTARQTCSDASKVVAIPVLGGLHHDYSAAA